MHVPRGVVGAKGDGRPFSKVTVCPKKVTVCPKKVTVKFQKSEIIV
jgi:hypothetical protein